ncbi:MAG: carboxypeptidase regulatory-like domain-containing protein [Thermoflexales bacterium]|nr:carboxypeptidase regulatory-like domain-containing protein [Thermoflexales bacterium]
MNKKSIVLACVGLLVIVAFIASVAEGSRDLTPNLFLSPFMSPIDGTVFDDADLDGVHDTGEGGLAGVTIQLRKDNLNVIASTSTNATGYYVFTNVDQPNDSSAVTVHEIDPFGYGSTTPNSVAIPISETIYPHTVNFGDHGIGEIVGVVFDDLNGNGIKEGLEPGLSGVTVSLLQGGSTISSTITGSNGRYQFSHLWLGTYRVRSQRPLHYLNTNAGEIEVMLTTPGQTEEWDFGYRGYGSVRGVVFDDRNNNQVQDTGEPGIGGVTITLRYRAGATISTTTTSITGSYEFVPVWLGDYTLHETDLPNYTSTTFNDVDFTLSTPGQAETINFGDQAQARVHGRVFNDLNANGVPDSGEPGIGGVEIRLIDSGGGSRIRNTGLDGSYEFTSLPLGNYTVEESDPSGFSSTTPNVVPVSLTLPGQDITVNFGDRGLPGEVSGTVFDDVNGNGTQDIGELGLEGVTITLKIGGTVITATRTLSDGSFLLEPVWPGGYTVEETDPPGYASTTSNVRSISLAPEGKVVVNFGDRGIGTIGGVVFNDLNGDGVQGIGEDGLVSVTLRLLQSGLPISTTTTNSFGSYSFPALAVGVYTVQEVDPPGYVSTTPNELGVSILPGSSGQADFGDQQVGTISGIVYNDVNGNGTSDPGESGIAGVTIQLRQSDSTLSTTTTTLTGTYIFTDVQAGLYTVRETDLVGYVSTTPNDVTVPVAVGGSATASFGDQEQGSVSGVAFNDTNSNGTQDGGESGIAGVTIQLRQGSSTLATTSTNSNGNYSFSGVTPGNYSVRAGRPAGFINTTPDELAIFIAAGGSAQASFGYQQQGTISGVAFNDSNGNGSQDSGEAGIGGVLVTLNTVTGTLVATMTTGSDGSYLFSGITPGSYEILAGEVPGYVRTTPGSAGVSVLPGGSGSASFGYQEIGAIGGEVFNDSNGSGIRDSGEGGFGGVTITLRTAGGTFVTETLSVGNGSYIFHDVAPGNYVVSAAPIAGFVRTTLESVAASVAPGSSAQASFGYQETGTIGGEIFNDSNGNGIKDSSEDGLGGVTVTLRTAGGTFVTETLSVGNGSYIFAGLETGDYIVSAADVPGFVRTTLGSVGVPLPAGSSGSANFGYQEMGTISGETFNDANGNSVRDSGEAGMSGVVITLRRGDGTIWGTVVSAGDGSYHFSNVSAGSYILSAADVPGYMHTTVSTLGVSVAPGGSATASFGYQAVGTVGGVVYNDVNGNGVRDSGEAGIGGVTVTLRTTTGTLQTTLSTGSGSYLFSQVAPGSYIVAAADVPGYVHTTPGSVGISIAPGGSAPASFGYQQQGSVGGVVYNDANGNGVRDSGEAGISGIVVTLTLSSGGLIGTATSVGNGDYTFSGVTAGAYWVTAAEVPGYMHTTLNPVAISVAAGGSGAASFGYQQQGTVSGVVYNDTNGNGVQDGSETGLGGVMVTLKTLSDTIALTASSTGDGSYVMHGANAGSYTVEAADVPGYVRTTANPVAVSVAAGSSAQANFGYQQSGTISGVAFNDLNGNGLKDASELGMGSVLISLKTGSGTTVMTTTSAGDGSYYLFTGLAAGSYEVAASDVPGYVRTTPASAAAHLVAGGAVVINFGYQQVGTIGGVVYSDANGNGVRDSGELGIGGVTVTLRTTTSTLQTTLSTGDGSYLLSGVEAGSYTVSAVDVPGYMHTTLGSVGVSIGAGGSASANFGYQAIGTVSGVVFNDANGNGVKEAGELGLGGVVITLTLPDGSGARTATSAGNGDYMFTNVAVGSYIVSAPEIAGFARTTLGSIGVSVAAGGSAQASFGYQQVGTISGVAFNDTNGNSTQDAGEPGIGSLIVTAQALAGTGIATATTTSSGFYVIGGLTVGSYQVSASVVQDFVRTTPSPVTVFVAQGGSATAHFGYQRKGTISGVTFNDRNGNGVQDTGEPGLAVTLTLQTGAGTTITYTTSTNNGSYSFGQITPGSYVVSAAEVPSYIRTTPESITVSVSSSQNALASFGYQQIGTLSGVTFNDLNGNGIKNDGEGGLGGVVITLTRGSSVLTTTSVGDGSYTFIDLAADNYTVAAADVPGYSRTTASSVTVTIGDNNAQASFGYRQIGTVSGMVFRDDNANAQIDPGEQGIGGVEITLLTPQGSVSATQQTAGSGYYLFSHVLPGDYIVRETTPPGFSSTTPDEVPITLTAGGSASANFGDRAGYDLRLPFIAKKYDSSKVRGIHLPKITKNYVLPIRFPVYIGPAISSRPVGTIGEVFYALSVRIPGTLPTTSRFYLSSRTDQATEVLVDDELVILVGGTPVFTATFSTASNPTPVRRIVEVPYAVMGQIAGRTVQVVYRDVYGSNVSADRLWLIFVD